MSRPSRVRRLAGGARAAVAAALALAAAPAPAGEDLAAGAARRVLFRAEGGEGAGSVGPAMLALVEEGSARPVAAVAPAGPWRIVLCFDLTFGEPRTPRNAAVELASLARELTAAGTVEVVLAEDGEIRETLPATRDPLLVEQTLSWLAVREEGHDAQRARRAEFLADLADSGDTAAGGSRRSRPRRAIAAMAGVAEAVQAALGEERDRLGAHHDALLAWAAESPPEGPALLLLVSGGFDADPGRFYREALVAAGQGGLAAALDLAPAMPAVADLPAALAASGWVVAPYRPATASDAFLAAGLEASQEPPAGQVGSGGSGGEPAGPAAAGGGAATAGAGEGDAPAEPQIEPPPPDFEPGVEDARGGIDLLRLARRRAGRAAEASLLAAPEAPLEALATASGGSVLRDPWGLAAWLAGLASWQVASYTGEPVGSGEPLRLELAPAPAAPPGLRLAAAPRWVGAGTPGAVAAARLRRLLAGAGGAEESEGEAALPLAAVLRPGQGGAGALAGGELQLEIADPAAGRGGPLRASIAVAWGEGAPPSVFHRLLATAGGAGEVPGREVEGGRGRRWTLPVPVAGGADRQVAVLVEELATARRGLAWVAQVETAAAEPGQAGEELLLPAPKAVHLLAPEEVLAVGPTLFRTVIADPAVARLEFRLDGEEAAAITAPPFAATLDLGPLPTAREVEVVAYAAGGVEVGRDLLVVNEGGGHLRVRIVAPAAARLAAAAPLIGPVDVEAEVRAPRGPRLERVEFYWNTERVATRFGPPWRHRLEVPAIAPRGFIRVVARLSDGSAAEDVVFLNSPGAAERLEVALVELYLVVTDAAGRPVRGLERGSFHVEEEGTVQAVATFAAAGELPLTVGLAIDASASMFVKLPPVQRSAAQFVLGLLRPRDRAFVVGFGDQPRLAEATGPASQTLVDAIARLEPAGETAIWKSIVYSLVQLQGVAGRKALIVYSDGADEDEEFPYRTCLKFARRLGIPIYVIIANSEIARTRGESLAVRAFLDRLERLAGAVGGRVFLTRVGEDLGAVYREIAEELRSQYLVAYYPQGRRADEWRRVRVEVAGEGLTARTIRGYYR